jgi:hypothetical protein
VCVCFLSLYPETGLLCHLDDACISNPCHKGALCDTNPLNGQYICTCPQGYKGADCTEDVDECAMGECLASLLDLEVCRVGSESAAAGVFCTLATATPKPEFLFPVLHT